MSAPGLPDGPDPISHEACTAEKLALSSVGMSGYNPRDFGDSILVSSEPATSSKHRMWIRAVE